MSRPAETALLLALATGTLRYRTGVSGRTGCRTSAEWMLATKCSPRGAERRLQCMLSVDHGPDISSVVCFGTVVAGKGGVWDGDHRRPLLGPDSMC